MRTCRRRAAQLPGLGHHVHLPNQRQRVDQGSSRDSGGPREPACDSVGAPPLVPTLSEWSRVPHAGTLRVRFRPRGPDGAVEPGGDELGDGKSSVARRRRRSRTNPGTFIRPPAGTTTWPLTAFAFWANGTPISASTEMSGGARRESTRSCSIRSQAGR